MKVYYILFVFIPLFFMSCLSNKEVVVKTESGDNVSKEVTIDGEMWESFKENYQNTYITATGLGAYTEKYPGEYPRNLLCARDAAEADAKKKIAEKIGKTLVSANIINANSQGGREIEATISQFIFDVETQEEGTLREDGIYELNVSAQYKQIIETLEKNYNVK